ncbi:MAG: dephospho-CoA kinase [Desulfovibrionaceae bacterium]|nr:dephospho-CoA kinase [Desulfovibrionaceae bacterium]
MRFVTTLNDRGKRLDRYLAEQLPEESRAVIKNAILNGHCSLNAEVRTKPDCKLKPEQVIDLVLPTHATSLEPETGPVEIIYADDVLAIINKPADLTVHPCPSCPSNTLIQRLLSVFPSLATCAGSRPGIVHRLDKDTSGLIAIALTDAARLVLIQAFAKRLVHKEYLALVSGSPPSTGTCQEPIGRHPTIKTRMCILPLEHGGKTAVSTWQKLWQGKDSALLKVHIATGRTHQIRVHLSHLGFPLLGDSLYAPQKIAAAAPRQMLHAYSLSLEHPTTHAHLTFTCPPPADFVDTAIKLTYEPTHIIITGNPGSGKSHVLNYLAGLGYATFSADKYVSELYGAFGPVATWLAQTLPQAQVNHCVNRTELLKTLQTDAIFKRDFETMIHGEVYAALEAFCKQHAQDAITFAEVPLWFECAWHTRKSYPTICVHAPQKIRFARLNKYRQWTQEKCATIESWQWPWQEKAKAATFVLANAKDTKTLEIRTDKLLAKIKGQVAMAHAKRLAALKALLGISQDGAS